MATSVLCYECGEYLGAVFKFIETAKQGYNKEIVSKTAIDIDKIELCGTVEAPIGFILDAANLTKICCRKNIIGYVDFSQYMH